MKRRPITRKTVKPPRTARPAAPEQMPLGFRARPIIRRVQVVAFL